MLDPVTPLGREAIRGIFAGMAAILTIGLRRKSNAWWHAGERLWIDLTPPLLTPSAKNHHQRTGPDRTGIGRSVAHTVRRQSFSVQRNLPRLRTIRHLLFGLLPMIVRLQMPCVIPTPLRTVATPL